MRIRPIFETSYILFADPLMFKLLQDLQSNINYHSEEDYERGKATMFNLIVDDYNDLHAGKDEGYEFAWREFKQFLKKQEEITNMKVKDKFSAGQKKVLQDVLKGVNEYAFYYDADKDPDFDGNFDREDVTGAQEIGDDLEALIEKQEALAKNGRNHRLDAD